ncbi:hypothetical protein [Marinigracilibium pacificum]|uniref:Uncharacterized protein n=1 Tax=Marinigracilibium pacificum TaxID=2729599 RepID=A0A848IX25_9BACT|nr:hypothetical protein [Marinigracilibium pacificum]NMM47841.1 hypothetical protein [Marinigracilibium pacificum]
MQEYNLIYDFTLQHYNLPLFIISSVLIIGGILIILFRKEVKAYRTYGQNTRLFPIKQIDIEKKSFKILTAYYGIVLIAFGTFLFGDLVFYIKKSNIERFENVKIVKGSINSFYEREVFEVIYYSFEVNNETFNIRKDNNFIGKPRLFNGSKVYIEYFKSNEPYNLNKIIKIS